MTFPWKGTLHVTEKQRRALRVSSEVSDALIDDALTAAEFMAYWRRLFIPDTKAQRKAGSELAAAWAEWAAEAKLFRTHMDGLGHKFFVGREIERGTSQLQAEQRFRELVSDLEAYEAFLQGMADSSKPRRGVQRDEYAAQLVGLLAEAWRRNLGKSPKASTTGPFVRFCESLGTLTGLDVTFDKVKTVLSDKRKLPPFPWH